MTDEAFAELAAGGSPPSTLDALRAINALGRETLTRGAEDRARSVYARGNHDVRFAAFLRRTPDPAVVYCDE